MRCRLAASTDRATVRAKPSAPWLRTRSRPRCSNPLMADSIARCARRAATTTPPPRPCGRSLAKGAACRPPARRSAPQLLSQVLVLAPQALVLTMHVFVARQFVFVARQFVAQPPDLPVLLLDDNVPRIPLRRGFAQNGAYTAQQVHVALVSAPRTKPLPHQADLSPGPR